jgi:hypothetical protein
MVELRYWTRGSRLSLYSRYVVRFFVSSVGL